MVVMYLSALYSKLYIAAIIAPILAGGVCFGLYLFPGNEGNKEFYLKAIFVLFCIATLLGIFLPEPNIVEQMLLTK